MSCASAVAVVVMASPPVRADARQRNPAKSPCRCAGRTTIGPAVVVSIERANITRAIAAFTIARMSDGLVTSGRSAASAQEGHTGMGTTKDIREAVNAELKFDPLVDDADIHVVNANGNVALNGTVPSYAQYLEAAAAAQRVGGVKNVDNHLQVVLSDANFRDDAVLTTAANNALTQNVTVPDGVEAEASDGNITLTGTASFGVERVAAEQAVAGLTGVRNVRDEIEISYDPDQADVDLHVQLALTRSALVPDDSDVKVATEGGIIKLTGHVHTWAEHDAVLGAAWNARGIID